MAGDSRAFREYVSEVEPDLDFVTQAQMESGETKEVTVPIDQFFFGPQLKYKEVVYEEIFPTWLL